ncbi:MAG: 2-oxoacid:acceptor oxidoreductase family protein [Candidatus Helarchaeota archaeon]
MVEDEVIQLRFHARGGQGGVTAAQVSVESFNGMGRAQPIFGAERMGSPTQAYATMSKNPELVQAQTAVYTPRYVGVLDPSLLSEVNVAAGMPPGGTIIVNTTMSFENLKKLIKRDDLNIAKVDATKIALDIIGRPITNTAILGALVKVSNAFTLDDLKSGLSRTFTKKIAELNHKVVERAYNETEVLETSVPYDPSKGVKEKWSHVNLDLPGWKDMTVGAVWYIPGGSKKVKTGSWGIYHIHWNEENCINCQRCFLTCPDFAILREQQPDGTWKVIGVDNFHCKACRCCIEVCPGKNGQKALTAIEKKIGEGVSH